MSPATDITRPDARMAPVPYRVTARHQETPDTWTVELEPAGNERLSHVTPGQFTMLYAFGAGEAPISVSRYEPSSGRVTHTIRAVGAVTEALCAVMPGHEVGARGPFGAGWPLDEAAGADVVLVAGGLGLPPLRPVLEHVVEHRRKFGRLSLLYGGRSPDELLYRDHLEHWRRRADVDVHVTVDRADSGWRGRVGTVTSLLARAGFDPGSAVAMIVGPEVMMRFTVAALRDRGVAAERIYVSLERSMHCAVGVCGHCMLGPEFICKDGPVFAFARVERWLTVRAL